MHTVQVLNHLVENNHLLAYLIIFVGLIFEGEIIVIAAGVLSYLGALNFWTALFFILAGGITKTFSIYYLGKFVYEKYSQNSILKYLERRVLYFLPRFKQKPFWSIFISKFIMSVNFWVIILSGYNKINFKTFLKAELISTIIWAPSLFCLGFFFSQTALAFSKEINKFSLVIFTLLVVFLLFDKLVANFYRIFEYFKIGNIDNGNENGNKQ
jgi:membrane protein DedA with SNARE-associated domain